MEFFSNTFLLTIVYCFEKYVVSATFLDDFYDKVCLFAAFFWGGDFSSLSAVATTSFVYFLSILSVATPCVSCVFQVLVANFCNAVFLLSSKKTDDVFAKMQSQRSTSFIFFDFAFPF